jgi:hypothetical protein
MMIRSARLVWMSSLIVTLFLSSVSAQTWLGFAQADPQRQYAAVKKVMEGFVGGIADQDLSGEVALFGGYDLDHCASAWNYIGTWASKDDVVVPLATLALDASIWNGALRNLKYPIELWGSEMQGYESAQLADMRRSRGRRLEYRLNNRNAAFRKQLTARLDAYRKSHPSLAKVINEGACRSRMRGGEVPLRIETEPPGATVFLIPGFFYELCKAQNIDPDDTARCNRWREVITGRVSHVVGDYFYVVRWADGATRRGNLSVVDAVDDRVILRKL